MPDVLAENTFVAVNRDNHANGNATKIILLSGFSDQELHAVIDAYRLNKAMPKAIFATVTELSQEFKVKDLLSELMRERDEIEKARNVENQL